MERISIICSPQESPILRFLLNSRAGKGAQSGVDWPDFFSSEQARIDRQRAPKRAVLAPRMDLKNVRNMLIFNIL